jgi:hypothetical protein
MSNLTSGLGLGIVFLYFYGKAVRGSFVYHKLEKLENPNYKATNKWTYIIGTPLVLVIAFVLSIAVLVNTGTFPSANVLAKDEINPKYISTLIAHDLIDAYDSVEYFYSEGTLSILEGGSILTQDRVIAYTTDEKEELQIYEMELSEITDVVLETQGDALNYSEYRVKTADPEDWLILYLPVEEKGDQKFIEALRSKLTR